MFNISITFIQKVNFNDHNPVKLQINKPGATPQTLCKVCMTAEPKNWSIDQEKFHWKEHIQCKPWRRSKTLLFLFFVFQIVKIWSTLFFLKVSISFSTKSYKFHFLQNQIPSLKSQILTPPPGKFFLANPRGCLGGCTQLELTDT